MRCLRLVLGVGLTASLVGTGIAAGQSPPQRSWEIEFHGGEMFVATPTNGTGVLPSPGPIVPALSGARPVSSWFFGDGAVQLNQATSFRSGVQIAPLDPVLQSRFVKRRSGGTAGFRIARVITRRLTAEFTFDYSVGSLALTNESASGLEASSATFVTTWNALLTSGLIASRTVSSVATISDHEGRQIVVAGTLLINPIPPGRLTPYVALGAGAISNHHATPRAVLMGDYQFTIVVPPSFPGQTRGLRQTDTVTVRSSVDDAPAWIVGGGVKYGLTERWGVRVDVRDHVSRNKISTLIDTVPASIPLPQFGVLAIFTDLQNPPLVFPSSLSGAPITGFKTFDGSGIDHHLSVTAGLFWRF